MGRCIENIKEWLHILAQYTFHYTCPVCHTTVLYEKGICPGCLAKRPLQSVPFRSFSRRRP